MQAVVAGDEEDSDADLHPEQVQYDESDSGEGEVFSDIKLICLTLKLNFHKASSNKLLHG